MAFPGEERWTHRTFDVGAVTLHAVETGEGPLVVLLHGFPDFWYGWRHQLGAIAAAGFRVVAPDLRGYDLSDKPAGIWSYRLEALAADVAGLVRACGVERAAIVGHDWGGLVAWHAALRYEGLAERLAILNAPTPGPLRGSRVPLDQYLRSWHLWALQVPAVPEAALAFQDFALLRRLLKDEACRPDSFTEADLDRYAEAMAEPGALSAAVDYYRALPWTAAHDMRQAARRFERPVMVIWGERDPHLAPSLGNLEIERVPQGRVERIRDAGHFVQLDARERVNELLVGFLRERR